jgi:uncharacterized Tic20 family protein
MNTPYDEVPPGPPPVDPIVPPPGGTPSAEERQWAMFAHLSALAGMLLTGAWFGWGCFVGPLIIWLVKKDTMPFVNDQGKESLNFNITVAIVLVALLLLTIVTFGLGFFVTVPLAVIVGIGWLVLTIVASVKANEGIAYRYPWCLRLIK